MTTPAANVLRIEALERRLDQVERELRAARKELAIVPPPQVRWARVTTSGTYPTAPCNCYEIVFVDGANTQTPGNQTITWTERSASPQAIATDPGGRFLPEDTIVVVARQRRNRQWLIIGTYIGHRWVRFSLPSGGLATTDADKASCNVLDYGGGGNPGSTLTINNLPISSDYMFEGDENDVGLAFYDDRDDKWWMHQLECG